MTKEIIEHNIQSIEEIIATQDHDTMTDGEWLDLMGFLDMYYAMMEMFI